MEIPRPTTHWESRWRVVVVLEWEGVMEEEGVDHYFF